MNSWSKTRQTKETTVSVTLYDQSPDATSINTGIGFFDHMLTLLAFHAEIGLVIDATGDIGVDDHHTVEDVGLVLGSVLCEAFQDKTGLQRYGSAYVPMDESLARVVIDVSNRPLCVYHVPTTREAIGSLSLENVPEFFKALAQEARMTVHIDGIRGTNDHHQIEAVFKAFGRALKEATFRQGDRLASTKGVL
jgi:imidazoleglycerol-phosphate dehydratase